jgi:glycosyltransferase involved in cell wall biosynthesis
MKKNKFNKNRINILHHIDSNETGGAETIFLNIIKNLKEDEYNNHILLSGYGWIYKKAIEYGFKPIVVKTKGSFLLSYLLDLIKYLKKHNINLIHSHLLGANVYSCIAGIILRIPVLTTFHGYADINDKDKLLKLKLWIIKKGAKKIIFVSEQLKKSFLKLFNFKPSQIEVIYNGIDIKVWRQEKQPKKNILNCNDDEIILIGAVGDVRQAKGYRYLLEAAKIIISKNHNCKFIVAGSTNTSTFRDLEYLMNELQLGDKFEFVGFLNDIKSFFEKIDIYVLPSITEGFSLTTIEAFISSVPVVATKCGGPEEIVKHNVNGLLVESCNPEAIAKGVNKILNDKKFTNFLTNNGKITVLKKFTLDRMILSYKNIYNEILLR